MDEEMRMVGGEYRPTQDENEGSLRPKSLKEYLGQDAIKQTLSIYMQAASLRREPIDHMLLYGPRALARRPWPACWLRRWARRCA